MRSQALFMRSVLVALSLACLWPAMPTHAYIDLAPTLPKIINDSPKIALVEVVSFNREKREVVLKELKALKGELSADPIRHDVTPPDGGNIPRPIIQWASPGSRAVMFASRATALICTGESWYQVRSGDNDTWKLSLDRPDLPLAYYGSLPRLVDSVDRILKNEDAVITVVAFGADNEGASFDLALNRQNLPGMVRVQRIRASFRMPTTVASSSANPAYLIGPGPVDEEDIPALIEKLRAADPSVRAEAAQDLRSLGRVAKTAAPALAPLLTDQTPNVRFSAASALLRITSKDTRGVDILAAGLISPTLAVRRDAAKATGYGGSAVAPLVEKLTALLKDSDESLRITTLQAITLLGPTAASAVPAVTPLLDNPDYAIDAADTLGRIGLAARPALPQLAKLLASAKPTVAWAAVRAMAQIGSPDAHPAVEYMIRAFPKATEVEGYNMMIYISLLGPDARDILPTLDTYRVKQPVLPSSTRWALDPTKSFPWMAQGGGNGGGPGGGGPGGGAGGGGRGGRGGPGVGGLNGANGGTPSIGLVIYEAYVHELGYRLRPVAKVLAEKVMDQTAGNVPDWGYRILATGPEDVLPILTPYLANDDPALRERAAVALGYMGDAAAPARPQLEAALQHASTEREKRLYQWCLREIVVDD